MITKDERRTMLGFTIPIVAGLLLVLPFIEGRLVLAITAVALALASVALGITLTAPIQPNREDYR
jgi:VIT1/CCC1 family predicted Fe2+/Mn2+ transporter